MDREGQRHWALGVMRTGLFQKDMKLTFFIRLRAKKVKQLEVPIYVRLRDESMDIWQKTFIMVAPEKWDPKTENLKTRIVIPAKEREEFSDQIHDLRKYIRQCYDRDVTKNKVGKLLIPFYLYLEKPCARDPRSPVPLTLAVQNSLTL